MTPDALLDGLRPYAPLAGEAAAWFREDWKRLGYLPLGLLLAYGLLPTRTAAPSVRPSATTRVSRAASPPPDGRAPGGSEGQEKAIRVSRRKEPAPKRWAVPELVPYGPLPRRRWPLFWEWEKRGYITCILGSGGTGKSYVLLDLAVAALLAQEWLGRAVAPARAVLYVDTELDEEECHRRAFPLARGRNLSRPPGGLHYLHLRHSLASTEGQQLVARVARRVRADLILVDSMTIGSFDVAASDQNGWNRVYTGMERWGVPVVCIDHMDKGGKGAFGSMMKQAKVRSMLQLTRLRDGAIKVEHTKSNFGPKVDPFTVYASFQEGPGGSTRFTTERPQTDDPPRTDAARISASPGSLKYDPPSGDPVSAGANTTPLRLVPTPLGRDGLCGAVVGWLKTSPPPEPWTRPVLRDGIVAAKLCNRGTAYAHLGHLLEDGLLVEADGALRLGEEPIKREATA